MELPPPAATRPEPHPSLVTTCHVTYGLHVFGLAIGALGIASVVGALVFIWPAILAVVLNYVKRAEARGTWLESHVRWQIRTFWIAFGLGGAVLVIGVVLIIMAMTYPSRTGAETTGGFIAWGFAWLAIAVWSGYRVIRGWMTLKRRQPMP
jgi:uncharacterized membrane protein